MKSARIPRPGQPKQECLSLTHKRSSSRREVVLSDQLDILGHMRSFETASVGNSEITALHEQMRKLEDKISKVELAQDSLRP